MTYDPTDPRSTDPLNPRPLDRRLDVNDPLYDPYRGSSRFGSPGQILAGLVLIIAAVVGLGLFFGSDTTTGPQTSEVQPQVQPAPATPETAPATSGTTSTN